MDKGEEKALKDIGEYGCHILHVMEDGDHPRFSYSIGIEKTSRQPEIIVTGLKQELAHWIINEYNSRIKKGEIFMPDKFYEGFLDGFKVTFKKVQKTYYDEYFGWAKWLYGGDGFSAVQLIYPSTSGAWPWDNNAPEDFIRFVPKLYKN
jgi:hypothetical protein